MNDLMIARRPPVIEGRTFQNRIHLACLGCREEHPRNWRPFSHPGSRTLLINLVLRLEASHMPLVRT